VTLVLDGVVAGRDDTPIRISVASGAWATLRREDAEAIMDDCTAAAPMPGPVLVDGRRVDRLPAPARIAAGLVAVPSRVGAVPALQVLDVVLLTRRVPGRLTTWRAALGSSRARTLLDDEKAAVRALAGRLGLGRWLDVDATELPADVAALVDLTRALAAEPRAVVWRRPEWLPRGEQADLAGLLADETARIDCAVLELAGDQADAGPTSLSDP
jgi:ABC-type branched-subunit amino acid transport system ATPase component